MKRHAELLATLKPFKNYPLIKARTSFIYLFSYISRALSTKDKLAILTYHYRFLQATFSPLALAQLFGMGIGCWNECINEEELSIRLAHSAYFEFEGSLSLLFFVKETCVYTLSFTVAAGSHFGVADEKVIYISRLQGSIGEIAAITRATKNMHQLIPPTILMSVVEGMALLFGIKKIIGISAKDQFSSDQQANYDHYYNYDTYWKSQGAVLMNNGNYLFSCPMQIKPIELIKCKYRGRTIVKRAKRGQVAEKAFKMLSGSMKQENIEPLTMHTNAAGFMGRRKTGSL